VYQPPTEHGGEHLEKDVRAVPETVGGEATGDIRLSRLHPAGCSLHGITSDFLHLTNGVRSYEFTNSYLESFYLCMTVRTVA
jgi:hypothetical protein